MKEYTEQQFVDHYKALLDAGFSMFETETNIPLSEEMFVECGLRGDPIDMVRQRMDGTRLETFGTTIGRFDIAEDWW